MSENTGVIKIPLEKERITVLDKHIKAKNDCVELESALRNKLAQVQLTKAQEQGACDTICEMFIVAEGYDFDKVADFSVDTDALELTVIFKPEPLHIVEGEVKTEEKMKEEPVHAN